MYRTAIPALIAASFVLAACQSSSNGGSSAGVGVQETQEQAIKRIEREGAMQRAGRGP